MLRLGCAELERPHAVRSVRYGVTRAAGEHQVVKTWGASPTVALLRGYTFFWREPSRDTESLVRVTRTSIRENGG